MLSGDEFYDDDVTSGIEDGHVCSCGSTDTVEISDERQSINVCANCGSDEP